MRFKIYHYFCNKRIVEEDNFSPNPHGQKFLSNDSSKLEGEDENDRGGVFLSLKYTRPPFLLQRGRRVSKGRGESFHRIKTRASNLDKSTSFNYKSNCRGAREQN